MPLVIGIPLSGQRTNICECGRAGLGRAGQLITAASPSEIIFIGGIGGGGVGSLFQKPNKRPETRHVSFLPNYECLGSDSGFRAVGTHVVWRSRRVVRRLCVSTAVESSFSEAECAWQVQRFMCCPVRGLNTYSVPPCNMVFGVHDISDPPPRRPNPSGPARPAGFGFRFCVLAIEPDSPLARDTFCFRCHSCFLSVCAPVRHPPTRTPVHPYTRTGFNVLAALLSGRF